MYAIAFKHRSNPRLTVISPPWFLKERDAELAAAGMRKINPKGQHQAVRIVKDNSNGSNNLPV